jgi:hypothetical protein
MKGRVDVLHEGTPGRAFQVHTHFLRHRATCTPSMTWKCRFEAVQQGGIMAPPDAKAVKAIIRAHRPKFRREIATWNDVVDSTCTLLHSSLGCMYGAGPRVRSSPLQCMPSSSRRATSLWPWGNAQMRLMQVIASSGSQDFMVAVKLHAQDLPYDAALIGCACACRGEADAGGGHRRLG